MPEAAREGLWMPEAAREGLWMPEAAREGLKRRWPWRPAL